MFPSAMNDDLLLTSGRTPCNDGIHHSHSEEEGADDYVLALINRRAKAKDEAFKTLVSSEPAESLVGAWKSFLYQADLEMGRRLRRREGIGEGKGD